MPINTRQAAAALEACGVRQPEVWAPLISEAAAAWGIDTPRRAADWIAQCAHESSGFARLVESLDYSSAARLCAVWPRRFPTIDSALPYVRRPRELGDCVYGGRMGNRAPGDGYLYRGRGALQITGAAAYDAAGTALGIDLLRSPELLEQPRIAALSAAWYWAAHGLNACADRGDVAAETRIINGGLTGLEQRAALSRCASAAIGSTK